MSTQEIRKASTFAGWGYGWYWTINGGQDSPRLAWEGRPGTPLIDLPRTYGGGQGTWSDPYLIKTPEDLLILCRYPEDWSKHFRLTADLDLRSVGNNFQPIGTPLVPFTGSFDGDGHKLKNLSLSRPREAFVGLFRNIARSAMPGQFMTGLVSNLTLESAQVTGCFQVGTIAGLNGGTILSCAVQGSIRADEMLGVLAGRNMRDALILSCQSRCSVGLGGVSRPDGWFEVAGGLVGRNLGGLVIGSTVNGSVTGTNTIAGLVAENVTGLIYRCGAWVEADVAWWCGAGLVGTSAGGSIVGCLAKGKVKGLDLGGCICGSTNDRIESCYFQGILDGYYIGGLVGGASGSSIRYCYSSAQIEHVPRAGGFARQLDTSVRCRGPKSSGYICRPGWPDPCCPGKCLAGLPGAKGRRLGLYQHLGREGW
ncbi:MAG: GLUG motif-containing protein [Sedimentisphaerales bacterium]|nr:GLUG motif-containing protein [Sedimentisphaerales bacterium]